MKKILMACVALILCGCATLEYNRAVFFIDPDVKLQSIDATSSVRERDGQTLLQIVGQSRKNQAVYYKVEWFDETGIRVNSSISAWKKVNLFEDMEFIWRTTSPSRRAVGYRVYITDDIGDGIIE